jgi:hypothetical protein
MPTTRRGCRAAFSATKASMTNEPAPLILKRASASRPSGEWNPERKLILVFMGKPDSTRPRPIDTYTQLRRDR